MADTQQFPADPGGNFDSDAHRRVLAHMNEPGGDAIDIEVLTDRIVADDGSPYLDETDEVQTVADELVEQGHAERQEGGFVQSEQGFDTLTGPIADEPPPLEGEALEKAEEANAKLAERDAQLEKEGSGHE